MSMTNNIVNMMLIYESRNKPVHRTDQGLVLKKYYTQHKKRKDRTLDFKKLIPKLTS